MTLTIIKHKQNNMFGAQKLRHGANEHSQSATNQQPQQKTALFSYETK